MLSNLESLLILCSSFWLRLDWLDSEVFDAGKVVKGSALPRLSVGSGRGSGAS